MYANWLFYTCRWATLGLDGAEMEAWEELTTRLEKHCDECIEGFICESCRNTGLKLTGVETMLLRNIELSLEANKVNSSH